MSFPSNKRLLRDGAFAAVIGAAVGTLFLVPAHGLAQDSVPVSCADVNIQSRLGDLILCAVEGRAEAQLGLGLRYYALGGPEDLALAVRWFRLAAEQGVDLARFNLGLMYDTGRGVPEDDTEAVRWYRLAAEQGYASAQLNLGFMYSRGEGVPEDLVYAYMWCNLSAAQGNEIAQENKDIIERQLTREQIAEAQRLSREWIETHPQDGGN